MNADMKSHRRKRRLAVLLIGTAAMAAGFLLGEIRSASADDAGQVDVYSYRQPYLMEPLFEAFTEQTGIAVNMVYAKAGLLERLKAEGEAGPADMFLTADLPRLVEVQEAGFAAPVMTETLSANIPAQYHQEDGKWWGLTQRARVVYASRERVPEGELTSYLGLADEKWKGRICIRPGDHPYNLGLIAAMIARHGEDRTKEWLQGVKANLARKPQGNDRAQVKAIYEGQCDLAIGNTYYMGKMLADPEQRKWAEAAYIIFPDQEGAGAHVNISGATVLKGADNREEAVALLEFLSGDKAQEIYAQSNYEYPVKPGVPWSDTVESWGEFKADTVDLALIADLHDEALRLVNEVDFNAGS